VATQAADRPGPGTCRVRRSPTTAGRGRRGLPTGPASPALRRRLDHGAKLDRVGEGDVFGADSGDHRRVDGLQVNVADPARVFRDDGAVVTTAVGDVPGPNGLLSQLTKRVLETALEAGMSDHLGYDKHDPVGRNCGNSRNGVRSKTVLTEIGPVDVEVPRVVDASFQLTIVKNRQRRLTGVDQIVLSLSARGLTTGEISAHLAEVTAPRHRRQSWKPRIEPPINRGTLTTGRTTASATTTSTASARSASAAPAACTTSASAPPTRFAGHHPDRRRHRHRNPHRHRRSPQRTPHRPRPQLLAQPPQATWPMVTPKHERCLDSDMNDVSTHHMSGARGTRWFGRRRGERRRRVEDSHH
jgi:hypothetical protein